MAKKFRTYAPVQPKNCYWCGSVTCTGSGDCTRVQLLMFEQRASFGWRLV